MLIPHFEEDGGVSNGSDRIKNNKFDEASVCLNNIFKLDADNSDAKKLKGDIADGQKQSDNEQIKSSAVGNENSNNETPILDKAAKIILKHVFPNGNYKQVSKYGYEDVNGLNSGFYFSDDISSTGDTYANNTDGSQILTGMKFYYFIEYGGRNHKLVDQFFIDTSTGKVYQWGHGYPKCKEIN